MKSKLAVIAIAVAFFSASCTYNRVLVSNQPTVETKKKTVHFFVMGFFPREIELRSGEFCPGKGVKEIRDYLTLLQALSTLFTAGMYAPRTVEVSCTTGTDR